MASGVRVTIELDREVQYLEQRLSGPSRVFFDLQNVQALPELKDKVLSYNSDVVNKIRVGRHPANVIRVVLDLEDVAKYSVFTLYSPFRIVVDAERTAARAARTRHAHGRNRTCGDGPGHPGAQAGGHPGYAIR